MTQTSYEKPSTGIPESDFSNSVKWLLTKSFSAGGSTVLKISNRKTWGRGAFLLYVGYQTDSHISALLLIQTNAGEIGSTDNIIWLTPKTQNNITSVVQDVTRSTDKQTLYVSCYSSTWTEPKIIPLNLDADFVVDWTDSIPD